MKFFKRLLAGLTFLMAAVLLLLSLAGGIGVWIVKEPVTAKATRVFGRIDAALDIADQSLAHVKTSLATAADRLETAKDEQSQRAREPRTVGLTKRLAMRAVQQNLPMEIHEAHEKLHTVAEAAVVVNSVLEDLGTFPGLATSGLDMEGLTDMNSRLADVGPRAWELSRLLGETTLDPDAAGERMSQIENTVTRMQGLIAEYEPRLTQVRQRTDALKSKTLTWITPAAVLVSFVCFWIALSQISLLAHARSWWKHACGCDTSAGAT